MCIAPAMTKCAKKKGRKGANAETLGNKLGLQPVISKEGAARPKSAAAPLVQSATTATMSGTGGQGEVFQGGGIESLMGHEGDAAMADAAMVDGGEVDLLDMLGSPLRMAEEGGACVDGGGQRLLGMMTEALERGGGGDTAAAERAGVVEEAVDLGLTFLAAGSENATDAEMECLAQSDGVASAGGSHDLGSPAERGLRHDATWGPWGTWGLWCE